MNNERNDDDQFVSHLSTEDVLAVVDRIEGPVVITGDVASETAYPMDTARRKLAEL